MMILGSSAGGHLRVSDSINMSGLPHPAAAWPGICLGVFLNVDADPKAPTPVWAVVVSAIIESFMYHVPKPLKRTCHRILPSSSVVEIQYFAQGHWV